MPNRERLIIIGAGGHGRVLLRIIQRSLPGILVESFLDDDPDLVGSVFHGVVVKGRLGDLPR